MPIRILHVIDSLGKGGLENGLVNLINRMDCDQFQHTVCAIRSLGPNADRLPGERVGIRLIGKNRGGPSFQVPSILSMIRESAPDVVHSRNWSAIETVFAARLFRSCGVVHSEHGLETHFGCRQPRRRVWVRRLAFELCDRVLCVSRELRDLHARTTRFCARRISVIHNGVDSRRFSPDAAVRARMRKELGVSPADFCIGAIGNLLPVKDHMTLLRAVGQLASIRADWRVVIAGDGPMRPDLESFLSAHPDWRARVHLVGLSDHVPDLLRAFDVYVLPSLAEGLSNALLEAMATGLPVIATKVGGNCEVVDDGCGLLFPIGDAATLADQLLLLNDRRDVRVQLGRNAALRVQQQFSLESMVSMYEEMYRSVAGRAGKDRAMAKG